MRTRRWHDDGKYTEEQILAALRHAEDGTTVAEVCRQV
jgi:hypothetical protein